jgi:excisionase family DNA binding protein
MSLTVPEAARRVGRNPETVRRWIRSGRLRSTKVGTQHVVDEADLEAIAGDGPTELPIGWRTTVDGQPMPQWEKLVRDSRSSH